MGDWGSNNFLPTGQRFTKRSLEETLYGEKLKNQRRTLVRRPNRPICRIVEPNFVSKLGILRKLFSRRVCFVTFDIKAMIEIYLAVSHLSM